MNYLERYVDDELDKILNALGAVLIVGPKWCGKTTTAKQHAKSFIDLEDPDNISNYLNWINIRPSKLLEGEKPRLIDEWQVAPILWDSVRVSVDKESDVGLYILTGSTVVDDSKIMHSGTGRIHRLMMRPMSLFESKDSNGKISLIDLFDNPKLYIDNIESDLSIEDLIFLSCRGGWPDSLNRNDKESQLLIPYSYVNQICQNDMSSIDGVKRDSEKVHCILKAYARNIATNASNTTILGDINSNFSNISKPTYYQYINALKNLFVIDEIYGWAPNIKSKKAIRTRSKKLFIDPSIAVAALNLSPELLMDDLNTFGFIFENLCIRDLKVYSSNLRGHISYYRDNSNLEADCVLHLNDGRYALIKFKLSNNEADKGAENLLKLDKLIKDANLKPPTFLAIITSDKFAYTRKDGVKVIPIGCLR